KSQKGQALLCYLALTSKAHSRPALAGLLWPEMEDEKALMNLRHVLKQLKRHLSPHLAISRQSIGFNQEVPYWLDVAEFEAGVAARSDSGRLQAAVKLYGGDFLDGFYLSDVDYFDEWVLAQRARLRELALAALHRLVTHFTAQAEYVRAIAYARQQLAIEPWREEGHRELMRLLALCGERSAALRQYETCRRIMAEEVAVEPAAETEALYQAIRAGQGSRRAEERGSRTDSHARTPALPHNLPPEPTPLIGRETELAKLGHFLAAPHPRLVTVVGLGGVGKTRLAVATARQWTEGDSPFTDGVYFVSLASLNDAAQLLPALARAVDFSFLASDARSPQQQILDYLQHKRLLLVLDNYEHLLPDVSLVASVLSAAPHVKLLVTSRERLRVYEEQVFPLAGLAYSAGEVTEVEPAVQLFMERARRLQPDFALRPADMPPLTTICCQVEGMPLGLELAAAWVDTLSLAQIAAELQRSLDVLRTDLRNVSDRHSSLRAVFDASWQRLAAAEQRLFDRISVFRGGFTQVAAAQVMDATPRQLTRLEHNSFLRYDASAGRYFVHELLRQFGAEKLAAKPMLAQATRERHSVYYCDFLSERTEDWHTARQMDAFAAVTRDADNIQQAWHWALVQEDWQRLVRAIDSLAWYYQWQGRFVDGQSIFKAVVEQVKVEDIVGSAIPPDRLRLWAKALAWQGQGWRYGGSNSTAQALLQQSLALLERPELAGQDTRPEKAFALLVLADWVGHPDRQEVRRLFEQCLALYQELGNQWGIAVSLGGLSFLDLVSGNYALAVNKVETSLAIHEALGNQQEVAISQGRLGRIHRLQGHLDEAERLHREALSLSRRIGFRSHLANFNASLADTLTWQGKFEEAYQLTSKALAMCQELGQRYHEGYTRIFTCQALVHFGDYRQTRQEAARALSLMREAGDQTNEGVIHEVLAQLALAESSYEEAQSAFRESVRIIKGGTPEMLIGCSLAGLGYAACRLGQLPQARQHLVEALSSALALKVYLPVVFALPGVALFLATTGDVVRAVEIWAQARRHPFVANSRWFDDVAGRELESLAATLPVEAAVAARERGRTLDLWQTAAALLAELEGMSIPEQDIMA
ncbi:MAG TPA: BTAD domain-containing putative transcriptional regulator, partial [Anaerolineae bacterium]